VTADTLQLSRVPFNHGQGQNSAIFPEEVIPASHTTR
jgi:hypothetical protein